MDSSARGRLREKNAHRQIAGGRCIEFYRVTEDQSIGRNRNCRPAAERENAIRTCHNCRPLRAQCDVRVADLNRRLPVSIGKPNPHRVASNAGMHDFAKRLTLELQFFNTHFRFVIKLRRLTRRPCRDPMTLLRRGPCARNCEKEEECSFESYHGSSAYRIVGLSGYEDEWHPR